MPISRGRHSGLSGPGRSPFSVFTQDPLGCPGEARECVRLPCHPLLGGTISVLLAALSFGSNTCGGSYMDIFDFQGESDAQKATVL